MADEMEGVVATDQQQANGKDAAAEPKQTVPQIIKSNFALLEKAVAQFDARFTLRALRSISSVRKRMTDKDLGQAIAAGLPSSEEGKNHLLKVLKLDASMLDDASDDKDKNSKGAVDKDATPEIEIYLALLIQVFLYDHKEYKRGASFSLELVDRIRHYNRRTLDSIAAKAYFYLLLFHEALDPKPPSPQSPVIELREKLLAALRSAVLRQDQETQAAVIVLLLRNYLSTADITQADLLVEHTQFPATASNNQVARYLYYLGRIRAIQLAYTAAHEHLTGATRKSPTSMKAQGFYQAAMKLLVVVELLMGDIPDRTIFRTPNLEHALEPYFRLVQAVRVGDLQGFTKVVNSCAAVFRSDGTYTLILRLRQNVIKTGLRMLSLSYSRISLRDICIRLGVESEESAEYIVAKAIRDGVIEATLDHEKGFMQSKQAGDIYATREPGEAFHERIKACLSLHDESVRAMRFPMNQHRLELKNAQEAREKERELAKEIQDGDVDEDDIGGDFEGL